MRTNVRSGRTIIVEESGRGHRLMYVRLLADALHAQGRDAVLALGPDVPSLPEYAIHLADLPGTTDIRVLADLSPDAVARLAHDERASLTVYPDGDAQILRVLARRGWRGGGTVVLLAMRWESQPGAGGKIKGFAKRRTLELVNALPGVRVVRLTSPLDTGRSRIPFVTDPLDAAEPAATDPVVDAADLDGPTYWFGVLGRITARKNVPLVLEALRDLPGVGFVLAGEMDADARADITRAVQQGGDRLRVVVVDRALSNAELYGLLRRLDCLVVAHSNEGPSGLLIRAATQGTRVVAAGARSLARDCAALGEGAEWAELDATALMAAFSRATHLPRPAPRNFDTTSEFQRVLLSLDGV